MGRPFNADAKATWRTIRAAGKRLIFKHGFEAMNLRQLAAESGLKPGSLYNYFDSKNKFLALILNDIMETILADLDKHVAPIEEPRERLRKFIEFHIDWHTNRKVDTFIGFMEMRNLDKDDLKQYIELRKQYEHFLTSILEQGAKQKKFVFDDVKVTTLAIIGMLTSVYVWYKKNGRLTQEDLDSLYANMIFKMIDVDGMAPVRKK